MNIVPHFCKNCKRVYVRIAKSSTVREEVLLFAVYPAAIAEYAAADISDI